MFTFEAMKIYTKTGDKGGTSLFGGTRVEKDNIKIEAYGTVDELNSQLGFLISLIDGVNFQDQLKKTQAILFDIGSYLASDGKNNDYLPKLDDAEIARLEEGIDSMTAELPQLKSFILPGGNQRIAAAHICRTVCRRAERRIVTLDNIEKQNPFIIIYMNRLSDYLFVCARYLSMLDGIDEVKWNPK